MKIMVEVDSTNELDVAILAALFAKIQAQPAPSINGDANAPIPLHPTMNVSSDAPVAGTNNRNETAVASLDITTPRPVFAPEYDTNGIPWDARIHQPNRGRTIKGEWKYKRGVMDQDKATVEASLPRGPRATLEPKVPVPSPPMPVPVPPLPVVNVAGVPTPISGVTAAIEALKSTPPPPPVVASSTDDDFEIEDDRLPSKNYALIDGALSTPLPAPPVAMTFDDFMAKVTAAMGEGRLDPALIATKLKTIGVDQMFALSATPERLPEAAKALGL